MLQSCATSAGAPRKSEKVYPSRILARSAREISRCAARARSRFASIARSEARADPWGTLPCCACGGEILHQRPLLTNRAAWDRGLPKRAFSALDTASYSTAASAASLPSCSILRWAIL